MRLTLRTLLSYLDDTLEPSQAKAIGQKVAESEQARDLMERIKQVTRRRRLTTPPTSGPGGIDPNTIAEYLDNDVTPEQAAEVEQICLASDVHLAEVAACHQILTLVLGEPALVPPTAKQRMYTLVKGPESIPFRKPAKMVAKDDQDLSSEIEPDYDESLRLGFPAVGGAGGSQRNFWLLAGGGVLAACLLVAVVWRLVGTPSNLGGDQIVQADDKDKDRGKDKKNDAANYDDDKKTKGGQDKKPPKKDDTQPDKLPITTFDPVPDKEPSQVEYKPANPAQDRVVGAYVPPGNKTPSVLLQAVKLGAGGWERVEKKVLSGRPLLSLSGSKNVVTLNTGVELTLWGNLPEKTFDHSVLESRAIVHSCVPQLDADLTLERGRIILRNKKTQGKDALIRLRFNDPWQPKEEFFDIVLNGADAAVVVDRVGELDRDEPFYEDEKDPLRKGPGAIMRIFALNQSANIRSGEIGYAVSETQQPMLQWDSVSVKLGPMQNADRPPWINAMPEPKDPGLKLAGDKSVEAHLALAKLLETKPIDVALAEYKRDVLKKAQQEMVARKPPSVETFTRWRHAIRCSAAVDDVSSIYYDFSQAETPIFIRAMCLQTLLQWLAWDRDKDYELLKAVRNFHNKIVSGNVMKLFHPISRAMERDPATFEYLIEGLGNDAMLPIRTLCHWHLLHLVKKGGEIPYDPAMPKERRDVAIQQWQALIPPGQLPGAGPPKKKKI